MSDLNRREFVVLTAAGICVAGCASAPTTQPAGGLIDVGTIADYPRPGVYDQYARTYKVLMVRAKDHIYASTAICTHKGCTLAFKDAAFRCPCHGSVFSVDGLVTHGPAKESLVHYAITVNEFERFVVDPTTKYDEKHWNQAGAYIKLRK